jgi:hypothetical protein
MGGDGRLVAAMRQVTKREDIVMQLLKEKDEATELAIDQRMLTLDGRYKGAPLLTQAELNNKGTKPETEFIRKILAKAAGCEIEYDHEHATELANLAWAGDPLSDEAILEIRRSGRNPHEVTTQFLDGGIDAVENPPEALKKIWEQVSVDPEWLDWDRLERGAQVYRRFGVFCYQFAGSISVDGYRQKAIGRTLMSTGQFSDETSFKRFLLTCNFWMQVSEAGGMRRHEEGWKTALRVRLLHTLIRRAVYGSDRWEEENFGMPINQQGLLGTAMAGSAFMGILTRFLGYRTTDQEIADMTHMWRYVSYIMGHEGQPAMPETPQDAARTMYHLVCINDRCDDPDGLRIGQSYFDSFIPPKELKGWEKAKRWYEHKVNLAHAMYFVPPETRAALDIPNTVPWGIAYFFIHAPKTYIQDTRRRYSKSYAKKLDARMTKQRHDWVKRQLNEADLVYRPASKF